MSTRISSALILSLALAACHSAPADNQLGATDTSSAENHLECAPQGATDFARTCTVDRIDGADGLTLVVHNPDGGFHRLLVTKDGRGVVSADGAEQAKVTIVAAGQIEVAIGGDRYRLPATVKAS
ncbi:hypothetical protein EAH79_03530 [Sphingomonas koreensis]|nr:hypothetical protein EAH79_03530 [Sphingomonas koreensis]